MTRIFLSLSGKIYFFWQAFLVFWLILWLGLWLIKTGALGITYVGNNTGTILVKTFISTLDTWVNQHFWGVF